jgi:hypothetical protein
MEMKGRRPAVSPLDWLAFWLTLAVILDIAIIGALFAIAIRDKRGAYRIGWVDGTMGREYGESYPGHLPYPARHGGEPVADLEGEWLPRTTPIDEPERPEETTLVGTVVSPAAGPPLPPHIEAMAAAVRESWDQVLDDRGETDTAWTRRMSQQVRERLGLDDDGPRAIGAGNVHSGGTGQT